MGNAKISEKTISYGKQHYRTDTKDNWQVLMFGSHGPNDPPVGLSWKWRHIPTKRVPDKVKIAAQ